MEEVLEEYAVMELLDEPIVGGGGVRGACISDGGVRGYCSWWRHAARMEGYYS